MVVIRTRDENGLRSKNEKTVPLPRKAARQNGLHKLTKPWCPVKTGYWGCITLVICTIV